MGCYMPWHSNPRPYFCMQGKRLTSVLSKSRAPNSELLGPRSSNLLPGKCGRRTGAGGHNSIRGAPSPRPASVPAEINRRWIGVRWGRGWSREIGERMLVRRGGHAGPGEPGIAPRNAGRAGRGSPRPDDRRVRLHPAPRTPRTPPPRPTRSPSHSPSPRHAAHPTRLTQPTLTPATGGAAARRGRGPGAHGSDAHSPRPSLARRDGRRLRLRRLPQQRPGQPERDSAPDRLTDLTPETRLVNEASPSRSRRSPQGRRRTGVRTNGKAESLPRGRGSRARVDGRARGPMKRRDTGLGGGAPRPALCLSAPLLRRVGRSCGRPGARPPAGGDAMPSSGRGRGGSGGGVPTYGGRSWWWRGRKESREKTFCAGADAFPGEGRRVPVRTRLGVEACKGSEAEACRGWSRTGWRKEKQKKEYIPTQENARPGL